jgi:hypothetical protein
MGGRRLTGGEIIGVRDATAPATPYVNRTCT